MINPIVWLGVALFSIVQATVFASPPELSNVLLQVIGSFGCIVIIFIGLKDG